MAAIGNFDGLHRGHMAVIERAMDLAKALHRPCVVLTFEPHPTDYFKGANTIFRLTPRDVKAKILEQSGVDGMIVMTFGKALASLLGRSVYRRNPDSPPRHQRSCRGL